MVSFDTVLGWAAIGLAASLAAMIWPFQRGPVGVIIRALLGMGGAVGLAFLTFAFLPPRPEHDPPVRLVFAAAGALIALFLAHLVFHRAVRDGGNLGKLPPAPLR